jgi:tellurite resistance protein
MVCVVVALVNCDQPPKQRYEEELAATSKPARHAVSSDRLKEIMERLNRNDSRFALQIVGPEHKRNQTMKSIARAAGDIVEAADYITEAVPPGELNEEELAYFRKLTKTLRAQALQLQKEARAGRESALRNTIGELQQTCHACHDTFRLGPIGG